MFFLGHLGIPFAIYEFYKLGFCWAFVKVFLVALIYEVFGGFGITAGAHRLWSHRSYKANIIFRSILMLFNCIAYQGELFYWCRDHRAHHKHSDTDGDPHNANRGFFFSHMGWLLQSRKPECEQALREIPVQDLLDDPVITFQLDYYPYLVLVLRVLIPWYTGYAITGSWRIGFFFNVCEMWCHSLHHTFLVNSAAHLPTCGYRPYDEDILPTEVPIVVFAALGEGHHNFHPLFPQDYATSELGWNRTFNPTKAFIDFGAWLGWVTERKRAQKNSNSSNGNKVKWTTTTIVGYHNKDE
jgi:stearoyl-CoA desaturase (delta-9 desaturase)